MRFRLWLVLAISVLGGLPAVAHESRPALLQLTETDPGRYDVLW